MLPLLISKPKLLPANSKHVKRKKNLYVTGDNSKSLKQRRHTNVKSTKAPPIVKVHNCDCNVLHLTKVMVTYAPKSGKRGGSNIVLSTTVWGATGQRKRTKLRSKQAKKNSLKKRRSYNYNDDEFFKRLETQLKALNIGKVSQKGKTKSEPQASERSKSEKDSNDGSEVVLGNTEDGGGEMRRRGKRRRKPRQGSDRLTSAGLAAQTQQDPETQVTISTFNDSGLMMELEGGHRNSVIKRRNPIEFGLV
ncbi:hypothetical protein EVAR_103172_1 [Eumeta japonica]|uniref:Uncharacterized protein n=1 Tax=Eumeta variegata TaxID=151549 RepID=A0A4C1YPM0_EUMVA|nr:hypothetical protein EVAR_103172_1 [Eumeta japonica]